MAGATHAALSIAGDRLTIGGVGTSCKGGLFMKALFRVAAAAVGWFAIGLQYWLVMTGDIGPDPINRTINFFSYFTILTNILAALAMTLPVIAPDSSAGAYFARPSVRTALATYIIVVGITYHLILRHEWNPEGLTVAMSLPNSNLSH